MSIAKYLIGGRSEEVRRYVFVPEILELRTNFEPIYSFVYGIAPGWPDPDSRPESRVTLHWEVTDDLAPPAPGDEVVQYVGRRIPGGREARMLMEWDDTQPRLTTNLAYVFWSSLRGTASHQLPGTTLSDMGTVALLSNGFAPIHCSAVAADDAGIVLFAPLNTGKTTTAWELVSRHGLSFIAEDIAVTDGQRIRGAPYTGTGLPKPFPEMKPTVRERARRALFPVWLKKSLAGQLSPDQIRASAPLRTIVFLERGDPRIRDVGREEAADLLLRNNRLEFRYGTSRHLLHAWYNAGSPDLGTVGEAEKTLLERTVANAEQIVLISAREPENFAQKVLDVTRG